MMNCGVKVEHPKVKCEVKVDPSWTNLGVKVESPDDLWSPVWNPREIVELSLKPLK